MKSTTARLQVGVEDPAAGLGELLELVALPGDAIEGRFVSLSKKEPCFWQLSGNAARHMQDTYTLTHNHEYHAYASNSFPVPDTPFHGGFPLDA